MKCTNLHQSRGFLDSRASRTVPSGRANQRAPVGRKSPKNRNLNKFPGLNFFITHTRGPCAPGCPIFPLFPGRPTSPTALVSPLVRAKNYLYVLCVCFCDFFCNKISHHGPPYGCTDLA